MLVSSYTKILHVFPEINDVTYNFASGGFERAPVRASADDVRADRSASGEQVDRQEARSSYAGSVDGRGADGRNEEARDVGGVDAIAFTDADFSAIAGSIRAAYDVLFPSGRGAYTPPIGVSDLERAVITGTVLRGAGRAAGRAAMDHVSERLLQRVSPQLASCSIAVTRNTSGTTAISFQPFLPASTPAQSRPPN
jgi:hypothetical protein